MLDEETEECREDTERNESACRRIRRRPVRGASHRMGGGVVGGGGTAAGGPSTAGPGPDLAAGDFGGGGSPAAAGCALHQGAQEPGRRAVGFKGRNAGAARQRAAGQSAAPAVE